MELTENGFIIAQKDLELRGPGELIGTRQSGLSDFALNSLVHQADILEQRTTLSKPKTIEGQMLPTWLLTIRCLKRN